jgi:hypothetical protein
MTYTDEKIREIAESIFKVGFKFTKVREMQEMIALERYKAIHKYKKDAYAFQTKNARPEDKAWIRTVHSEPAYILIMINDDRIGDPIWVDRITKKEIISAIEDAIKHNPHKALTGTITIAADAGLYYYDDPRGRLSGERAEPTGEYWSLDLVQYSAKQTTGVTWGEVFDLLVPSVPEIKSRFQQDIKINQV